MSDSLLLQKYVSLHKVAFHLALSGIGPCVVGQKHFIDYLYTFMMYISVLYFLWLQTYFMTV